MDEKTREGPRWLFALQGVLIGLLVGFVGAGGGFLIFPALVCWAGVPLRMGAGTSLAVIAMQSLLGFTGEMGWGPPIDWPFLLLFTGLMPLGIPLGHGLGSSLPVNRLKLLFSGFLLILGTVILGAEWIK